MLTRALTTSLRPLLFLTLACTLAACAQADEAQAPSGDAGEGEGEGEGEGGNDGRCVDDSGCLAGYCIVGRCQNVQCRLDEHCPLGQKCDPRYRCVAAPAGCVDGDGDGYGTGCELGPDCDDGDGNVNPRVIEDAENRCGDGVDHDCDGADVECGDRDDDGDGVTGKDGDCDDSDPLISPRLPETPYNGIDDDCDPGTRDDDVDGDGFGAEALGGQDCDDANPNIHPDARDVPGNGIDEDCADGDEAPDDTDRDGDGVSSLDGDCNDGDPNVNPNRAEVPYNGVDDDCDGETPDNDLDGDGVPNPPDCDDTNGEISPRRNEVLYNGADDDCDPETADDDGDGDGFRAIEMGGDDCNDGAAGANPGAEEVPYNGVDDDCDPGTPDDDLDGDGALRATDCDDDDAEVHPGVVENADVRCSDGIDHDCRGGDVECDAGALDTDDDGVPDDQDCEPANPNVPGPAEVPNNGVDDDCDPATPDEVAECDDDGFDAAADNGTSDSATAVADGSRRGLQFGGLALCAADDEDWYSIRLTPGDGLEVDLFFEHAQADVDVALFKAAADGNLVAVSTGTSANDDETVYERRATEEATYFIRVYLYNAARTTYGMTVHLFDQCTDDTASFFGADEHNDTRPAARPFPAAGSRRQICEYDDDWYRFTLAARRRTRIDLLFPHAGGDIDLELYADGQDRAIFRAVSTTDDELIDEVLDAGSYAVRVYGIGDATNPYRLFRTSGQTAVVRSTMDNDVPIPDYAGGQPGVATTDLQFAAPAGAVIRSLRIRDLDINHSFLRDLVVSLEWNGEPIVTVWNRQGDRDGGDGGEDDDFLPFTGGDINFDNRDYAQFAGLAANGTLTLRIEDRAVGDTGELVDLDVEITYLVP